MNQIHDTNDLFDFDNLKLSKPTSVPGGSYFIRFGVNNSPLYIQPPKCKTKQGFLKAGKRLYTDLMFTNEDDDFIRWMENLENMCHQHLHKNREKWFEGDMELHDIENYFTSPLKIFKTGKYYIARVFVQTNLGNPALTIYDEDNNKVNIDSIDDKTEMIPIIELKGIKCTATSFLIEMEMKQLLLVKPVELFSQCRIKQPFGANIQSATPVDMQVNTTIDVPVDTQVDTPIDVPIDTTINVPIDSLTNDTELDIDTSSFEFSEKSVEIDIPADSNVPPVSVDVHDQNDDDDNDQNDPTEVNVTIPTIEIADTELEEIDIHLDELPKEDGIVIKNKNDVYYEMYREACRKAKIARDLALSSYLEAKRIKNAYMLDDISDSDESADSDDNEDSDENVDGD